MQSLVAFLVGTSFAATFVTHTYVRWAFEKGGTSRVGLPMLGIGIRLAYGVANVINVRAGNTVQSSFWVGACLGLFLSLVGRSIGLPHTLFKMDNAWHVHVIAPILYAAIFVLLVRNLNHLF